MFESIKTRLANRRLQKARGGESRRVRACGLELANKIGILYDATDEAQFDVVRRLLFKLKNTIPVVKALGYVDSEELSDFHIQPLEFSFFCRKDLDRLRCIHPEQQGYMLWFALELHLGFVHWGC